MSKSNKNTDTNNVNAQININEVDEQDILKDIKEKFNIASQAWEKQYNLSKEDMLFCSSEHQWPSQIKMSRTGRPTYASDRTNAQVKTIVNTQRDNKPAIIIHPTNDSANIDTAEVLQGLVRSIEVESNADLAYISAFEDAVRSGIGFFRVLTDYEDGSFDQKIIIDSIINPFSVYIDPYFKKPDGSDIEYAFIIDTLSKDEFNRLYPNASASELNNWVSLSIKQPQWFLDHGKSIQIAEFFVKDYKTKTIVKLSDGRVLDKKDLLDHEKELIQAERSTLEPIIKWYKVNGIEILDSREWPGKFIPVIPVFGDVLLEDDKRIWSGLVRQVKEEQMMKNVVETTIIELIAAAPKTPWVGPKGFVGDQKDKWQDVNLKSLAYIEYESKDDDGNPLEPPQRNVAEPPVQGALQLLEILENDIKATNNLYDPSQGQKIANQSGIAVKALQMAGSIANYHFSDNLSRAIRVVGTILVDLIPKVYSAKRVVRIIGIDDKHKLVTINGLPSQTGAETEQSVQKIYDVTVGKYDVSIESGPSFHTKREQNLDMLFNLASQNPNLLNVAGDLIVSQIDDPIAIQLAQRLEKTLPPGLADDNQNIPPAVQQALQQQQKMIQQLTQTLQKETQLADHEQAMLQAKLKIAEMDQQTELMKHQATLQHQMATIGIQNQLKDIQERNKAANDLLQKIAEHHLNKDLIMSQAQADMVKNEHKAVTNMAENTHSQAISQPPPMPAIGIEISGKAPHNPE